MSWTLVVHFSIRIHLNSSSPSTAYMRQRMKSALVQIMACRLFGTKPLSKPMLGYCQLDSQEQTSVKFQSKYGHFHSQKCIWKYHRRNGNHFVQGQTSWYRRPHGGDWWFRARLRQLQNISNGATDLHEVIEIFFSHKVISCTGKMVVCFSYHHSRNVCFLRKASLHRNGSKKWTYLSLWTKQAQFCRQCIEKHFL